MNLLGVRKRFSSLEIKFTLIAFTVGLVSFGVAAIFSNVWTVQGLEKQYREKADLIWKHIIADLEEGMIFRNHQWVFNTLNGYRDSEEVEELKIFDTKGREVFFRNEASYLPRIEEILRAGKTVHFDTDIGKERAASYVIPLKNKPECQECHGDSEKFRGALLISLSTAGIAKDIAQQRKRFFLLFTLMALAISLATLFAVDRLVIVPLKSVQKGTESIEQGHFEYQIPVKSGTELGDLARGFNHMAQTLQRLFEQVSHSQKEWQQTFDGITDPIAVITSDLAILRANRAFVEQFSQDGAEKIRELTEPLGRETVSGQQTPVAGELPDVKTGKSWEVSLFPYSSGSIFIAKDVTEKRKNEMRLIMSERLAALGEMASGIAHEINNPLATIRVCAEGLVNRVSEGKIDPARFEKTLNIILEELTRCSHITTSMLSFVRKRSNGNQNAVVSEVLDRTLEMVGLQGRLKQIEVLKRYKGEMPPVHSNEGELRQVFLSIILNALDAMDDRGRIEVETAIEGNNAIVKFIDTGPGISPTLVNRIFDPFFTTKSEGGGTGLGLSIADKIMKEIDGKIEVSSEPGKGTTFTITLPLSTPQAKAV